MANEEEMDSPPPERKSKLMPIFLAVNSLMMLGLVALQFLKSGGEDVDTNAPAPSHQAPPPPATAGGEPLDPKTGLPMRGPTIGLGEYVVHLRNPDMDRYARFEFQAQLGRDSDIEYVKIMQPEIRDRFIAYLNDRSLEELTGSAGLEKVKSDLFERLDTIIPGRRVKAIFLTEFVIQ
jgi:flagellar FliL protein